MNCPECKTKKMFKAGFVWSGRHKVQRFKCGSCGRTCAKIEKTGDNTKK